MSTFSGINTALSGLIAYQRALDITGQNIANVATPGYHRQEVVLGERVMRDGTSSFPAGVDVVHLRRADTAYLNLQLGLAVSEENRWSTAENRLNAVQSVLSPATGQDLSRLLDSFWNAWQGLSASPEAQAPRLAVQQAATQLTSGIQNQYRQLGALRNSLGGEIAHAVDTVNDLAARLADLNAQLRATEAGGGATGTLLDQRQQLLDDLAAQCGAVAFSPDAPGGPIVTLGGRPLVQGTQAFRIEVSLPASGAAQFTWAESGQPVTLEGGTLAGLAQVRDESIPSYLTTLDDLASALITEVNELHATGAGLQGQVGPFFAGTGAADIRLADAVAANANAIAAGPAGHAADGSVASAIAALQEAAIVGGTSPSDVASGLLARIGGEVSHAQDRASAAGAVREQMAQQQQAEVGVSLDEEMTKMLQYQDAYSAASRVLVTMNEMLEDLINIIR